MSNNSADPSAAAFDPANYSLPESMQVIIPVQRPDGTTMEVPLTVDQNDISIKVLGKRPSFVVGMSQHVRDQLNRAMEQQFEYQQSAAAALSQSQLGRA